MSKAIRGTGEFNIEFDKRMEAIQKLYTECFGEEGHLPADSCTDPYAREAELASEVARLCDWINGDPSVRRNLNGKRYLEVLEFRRCLPEHRVWGKIETMLRTRQAQNSVERKRQIKEQREARAVVSVDAESGN